jgi:hypothetical protein
VPQGVYRIGVDIPDGKWTIAAKENNDPNIWYGDTLDSAGMKIVWSDTLYYGEMLAGHGGWREENLPDVYPNSVIINLKPGAYFIVESGKVLFSPRTDVPVFDFK